MRPHASLTKPVIIPLKGIQKPNAEQFVGMPVPVKKNLADARAGKARTRMGYDYILEAMQVTRMVLVVILMKILGKKILLMVMMATDKAKKVLRSTTILAIFLSLMMILKMILLMILMLILIITMVWTKEKQ